ncbi:Crp/Fnr family transcriptional regulator [Arsenicibacter rosenii]|uniref:Cyclic nucleotide-binding domain-containing protein n=1 Tax=Arsenicibacter rosenii TaxID=1750698 RepID=A0A1S2VC22_9BACT|nr:Crp/Fnr family transcriptional regulator [Arsenicibacter rosenii]OIN56242.1 hypothetical protein BLX24_25950 [Arsenicibacter rosenii]
MTIIEAITAVCPLRPESRQALTDVLRTNTYRKHTELLTMGQVAHSMYFIRKGLARVYYYYKEMDVTDYFAIDGQFVGAVPSAFTRQPTRKAIQLIENSEVDSFSLADVEACCAAHHDLERAVRKMAFFALIQEQERIESLRFHSAAERYAELEKQYPGISNRCPLKYIASYLGTTQVSLSRIRAGVQ